MFLLLCDSYFCYRCGVIKKWMTFFSCIIYSKRYLPHLRLPLTKKNTHIIWHLNFNYIKALAPIIYNFGQKWPSTKYINFNYLKYYVSINCVKLIRSNYIFLEFEAINVTRWQALSRFYHPVVWRKVDLIRIPIAFRRESGKSTILFLLSGSFYLSLVVFFSFYFPRAPFQAFSVRFISR